MKKKSKKVWIGWIEKGIPFRWDSEEKCALLDLNTRIYRYKATKKEILELGHPEKKIRLTVEEI